jgi:hypothetical protein
MIKQSVCCQKTKKEKSNSVVDVNVAQMHFRSPAVLGKFLLNMLVAVADRTIALARAEVSCKLAKGLRPHLLLQRLAKSHKFHIYATSSKHRKLNTHSTPARDGRLQEVTTLWHNCRHVPQPCSGSTASHDAMQMCETLPSLNVSLSVCDHKVITTG